MRKYAAFLVFACLVCPCSKGTANTVASSSNGTQKNSKTALSFDSTPLLSPDGSPARSLLFPVWDEKGLLLTCIAPEIEKDANTDIFNDCALAPGRTLDDVMHAFVGAIRYEQNQRSKEQVLGGTRFKTETDQRGQQK